jgi:hypothetical protein
MFVLKAARRLSGREPDNWKQNDWPAAALCLACAALSSGFALRISDGFYNPFALLLLTLAYALCVLGCVLRHDQVTDELNYRLLVFVLTLGFAFQLVGLSSATRNWRFGILTLLGLAVLPFIKSETLKLSWVRLLLIASLLVPHVIIGLAVIRRLPNPNFDVYLYQMQSLKALLKGINPHTLTIGYGKGDEVNFNPAYIYGGRIHIGFPYPPLSLLLALPGYLLGGDYRYSNLAATTLSGLFIASARPSHVSFLAAAIFLSTPCMPLVLKMGWTEPYVILLLSATVFCACRAPRYLPWVLGLLFAVKQYAILAGLAVFLLPLGADRLRDYALLLGKALLLATVITLPMALWNVSGFVSDVLVVQFQQPFRLDALSYLVWFARQTGVRPPSVIAFLMVVPAVALMVWRGTRAPSGFAAAVSLILFTFFAFNKQAFVNYYFLVVGALCCALAAMTVNRGSGPIPSATVERHK